MQTATGTRQEEENNIAILQQQHIVRLNVLFKTISIRNEKSVGKRFNAQGSYNEICEKYRREKKK